MKTNKIKLYIIIIISIIAQSKIINGGINSYFDKPLFNYSVEKNLLPVGNFRLLRSYGIVTQIMESIDGHNIILHTDRDNRKHTRIKSSAYSTFHNVFLETREISQDDFNIRVEHLLKNGDLRKGSTHKYPGLLKFCNLASDGKSKFLKKGTFYNLKLKEASHQWKLKLDFFRKDLYISNIMNEHQNRNFILYSIYIENSKDRNIRKIVRKYISLLYDIRNKN